MRRDETRRYLQQFMDEDARLVHHRKVKRPPVLEEGQVDEFALDLEVVVLSFVDGLLAIHVAFSRGFVVARWAVELSS